MIDHGRFRCVGQQLRARELLAQNHLGVAIKSYQVEGGLPQVNTDRSDKRYVHAMILRESFPDHPTFGG